MPLLNLASVVTISPSLLLLEEWQTWKVEHGKTYGAETKLLGGLRAKSWYPHHGQEEAFRMKVWMENKVKIERHNQRALQGDVAYHLGMNQYGDLLHHEFVAMLNGYTSNSKTEEDDTLTAPTGATFLPPANMGDLPRHVDWRQEGAVTPVKDQGQCGSCWSFATTGALEAMHHRATGVLTSLSEQQLIDCSRSREGNAGCRGGSMDLAFQYIKETGGIDTEESYPYEGEDDMCRYRPAYRGARDTGFVDIQSGNEEHLAIAIATQGPVAIAFDASRPGFQFYSHGVYWDTECSSYQLDHGVLAVGYGVQVVGDRQLPYWLIKNSWAATWGDEGYFKMARNMDNMCGVATMASYPTV